MSSADAASAPYATHPPHSAAPAGERAFVILPNSIEALEAMECLVRFGFDAVQCPDLDGLGAALVPGELGVALLSQEALASEQLPELVNALSRQPPWSDLPLLILIDPASGERDVSDVLTQLLPLTSTALLERPLRAPLLRSAMEVALRNRRRQYQVRDYLAESLQRQRQLQESAERIQLTSVRLQLQHSVSRALGDSVTLKEAAPRILESIGSIMGWEVGAVWMLDETQGGLACLQLWEPGLREAPHFRLDSATRTFAPGVGVPGLVWASGAPIWIPDVLEAPNFPRATAAAADGLYSSFGFPIRLGSEVLGVIEFFSSEIRQPDSELLDVLASLGSEIGQFIQRRRAEARVQQLNRDLRDRVDELQTLMDVMPVGIAVSHDAECRVITANAYFTDLLGMPRGANISRSAPEGERIPCTYLKTGCPVAPEELPMQQAARRGKPVLASEWTLGLADGRVLHLLVGAAPLFDPQGQVRGCIGAHLDITARRAAEEALLQAQKLESVGLLAGGVAHDFNNILTGIMGNASLAQEFLEEQSWERALPLLEEVVRSSQRAAGLTQQLLAYAGKGRFELRQLDLSDLVRDVTRLVRSSISRKVELELDPAPGLPRFEGDTNQIRQLLMNLVINGAEAIDGEHGLVRVSTSVRPGSSLAGVNFLGAEGAGADARYVCLEVQDSGAGMDEATMARIFDPFFSTKFTGRGLGLAAAIGIVRGHHGGLRVDSSPGRGTTFLVALPALAESHPPGPSAASHLLGPSAEPGAEALRAASRTRELQGAGTVLVVDDEDAVRAAATAALERYGYTVVSATDGRAALRLYEALADRVALVLLDLTMPGLDGEETYARLRQLDPRLRIVISSGYNQPEMFQRLTEQGQAGFIQKPYTAAELARKLKEELGLGRRRHRKRRA